MTSPRLIALLLLLALAPNTAHAGGAYEINQDCVAVGCFPGDNPGFPVTLNTQGLYRLTSDLVVSGTPGSTVGIDIDITGVELDLDGHTIDGGGSCTGSPVSGCAGALASIGIQVGFIAGNKAIVLRDGSVRGFSTTGVSFHAPGSGNRIENLTVAENAGAGMIWGTVSPSGIDVRRSRFVSNGTRGLTGGYPDMRMVVEGCVFASNGDSGFLAPNATVVRNNYFRDNELLGLDCYNPPGCAFGDNAFFNNNGSGTAVQFSAGASGRDMGGNVCQDGTCP